MLTFLLEDINLLLLMFLEFNFSLLRLVDYMRRSPPKMASSIEKIQMVQYLAREPRAANAALLERH